MAGRKTVLIVDDDEGLRYLFSRTLALEGFDVKQARGGFEALRMLDNDRPDIIILDLTMPGVDGFVVRNELAAHAHTRDIPVVIVTGLTEDLQHLDVPCILKKPVTPGQLVAAVRKCLASGGRPGGA